MDCLVFKAKMAMFVLHGGVLGQMVVGAGENTLLIDVCLIIGSNCSIHALIYMYVICSNLISAHPPSS